MYFSSISVNFFLSLCAFVFVRCEQRQTNTVAMTARSCDWSQQQQQQQQKNETYTATNESILVVEHITKGNLITFGRLNCVVSHSVLDFDLLVTRFIKIISCAAFFLFDDTQFIWLKFSINNVNRTKIRSTRTVNSNKSECLCVRFSIVQCAAKQFFLLGITKK